MISDETPVNDLVWNFIKCSVPVCTIMAPLGSFLGSHFHRQVFEDLNKFLGCVLRYLPTWCISVSSWLCSASFLLDHQST